MVNMGSKDEGGEGRRGRRRGWDERQRGREGEETTTNLRMWEGHFREQNFGLLAVTQPEKYTQVIIHHTPLRTPRRAPFSVDV